MSQHPQPPTVPAWRRLAAELQAERLGLAEDAPDEVDPAAFDLDDDCCLGGCCEKGTAYLAALDAAAARREARGRSEL